MVKLFANNGDSDQTPQNAASDLGLHSFFVFFFHLIFLRVSRLKWVNSTGINISQSQLGETCLLTSSLISLRCPYEDFASLAIQNAPIED